jgi:hypothetical protein
MNKATASNLLFIREEFKRKDKELEKSFLAKLNLEEKTTYTSALAFDWIPVTILASLWEKASQLLYPNDTKSSLRKLGAETMRCHLKGVYRVAMHITGIPFVIERSASVWETYHDTGTAKCEKRENKKELAFIVSNYPNLPEALKETVAGSTEAIIEAGGGKSATVIYNKRSDNSHEWVASWS